MASDSVIDLKEFAWLIRQELSPPLSVYEAWEASLRASLRNDGDMGDDNIEPQSVRQLMKEPYAFDDFPAEMRPLVKMFWQRFTDHAALTDSTVLFKWG